MTSAALESEAAFRERCRKVGLTDENFRGLTDKGYATFGSLAFAAGSSSRELSDDAVADWIRKTFAVPPSDYQTAVLRRLLFESQTLNLAELKGRIESLHDANKESSPLLRD